MATVTDATYRVVDVGLALVVLGAAAVLSGGAGAPTHHAKNKTVGRIMQFLALEAQNPGSGRKIPAEWHGADACHGVVNPDTWY